jgi:hypothetical protein
MDFIRQISNQRAIEALRNGVPNHDAVKALGCNQPEIEEAFMIQLRKAEEAMQTGQGKNSGIIIAGDFGSGKSHLLEYLTQVAFKQNFVCSKIVISKETPLFDPARLYRAAAESAVISGKRGNAMTEVITSLANKLGTRDYDSLYQWTHNDAGINAVFGAILHLYRLLSNDPEVRNRIIQFLNGDKINIAEIRRLLRICGDQAAYRFDKTSALDFAMQKFKFVSRLIGAAGYSGWVLFFDEIELIARYSLRQRAKSYAEIARWLGKLSESDMAGIASVLAITEDYTQAVLNEKDDLEKAPGRLRASNNYWDQQLAISAEKGIGALNHDLMMLNRPDREEVSETFRKVKEIYAGAYGWEPDQCLDDDQLTSTRMRQHIRGWITGWDLKRLDADYQPDIETERLILHYDEDADLEIASDEDLADNFM